MGDQAASVNPARAALAEARAALKRAVIAQPLVLKNNLEQARLAENNLGTESHEQEKAALTLNKAAIGYLELARQAAAVERGREVNRRFLGEGTPYTPQSVDFYGR